MTNRLVKISSKHFMCFTIFSSLVVALNHLFFKIIDDTPSPLEESLITFSFYLNILGESQGLYHGVVPPS